MDAVRALTPLAPLHNPANLQAVDLARALWPEVPQVGVFDTAFHLSNPRRATTYAVPKAWRGATRGCGGTDFTARRTNTWPSGPLKRSASRCAT